MKTISVFLTCIGFLLTSITVTADAKNLVHPFYVSVTEVTYKSNTKNLEISCKMFAEDIEQILKLQYNKNLSLTNDQQKEQNNKFLNDYFRKHFSVNVDSKPITLKYVGFEKERESIYCYFEVEGLMPFKKIDLKNNILTDYKDEQINILHVVYNGTRKSGKSDGSNLLSSFTF